VLHSGKQRVYDAAAGLTGALPSILTRTSRPRHALLFDMAVDMFTSKKTKLTVFTDDRRTFPLLVFTFRVQAERNEALRQEK